jgi:4-amino-4-deoxy-L-arabinose transferase-like glycosyltransferase
LEVDGLSRRRLALQLDERVLRRVLVVVGIAFGLGTRLWTLRTPFLGGYFDSDEAVPGLMARHLLHGEWSTFYWGQAYGGTAEVALVSVLFWIVGSGVLALRLVPIALYGLGTLLVWRLARRTIGEPGATVAAILFWISPAYLVFRSTREYGYQGVLVVLGIAILLFTLRLAEAPTRQNAAGLGLAVGLAWWTSIQSVLLALPALVWLACRQRRVWRLSWLIGLAAFVGAFPWLAWNLRNHWGSLHVSSTEPSMNYAFRLGGFFADGLPMSLGFRVPFLQDWLPSPTAGKIGFVVVGAALAAILLRRFRSLELVAAVVLPYPFLYALSSFTANRLEPRYLLLLAPLLALLLGELLADLRAATVGLVIAATLSLVALVRVADNAAVVAAPPRLGPLLHTLEREHVTRAWADYWIAFRVTFLTHERIIVAPTYGDRYPHYRQLVEDSSPSAWIFVARTSRFSSAMNSETPKRARLLHAGFTRIHTGEFILYVPPSPGGDFRVAGAGRGSEASAR